MTVGGTLTPGQLTSIGDIIGAIGDYKHVHIFPKGIPATPDAIGVKLMLHR